MRHSASRLRLCVSGRSALPWLARGGRGEALLRGPSLSDMHADLAGASGGPRRSKVRRPPRSGGTSRQRVVTMRLGLLALPSVVASLCSGDLVQLDFKSATIVNDNFAGRDAASEAAGLAQNIRLQSVG